MHCVFVNQFRLSISEVRTMIYDWNDACAYGLNATSMWIVGINVTNCAFSQWVCL